MIKKYLIAVGILAVLVVAGVLISQQSTEGPVEVMAPEDLVEKVVVKDKEPVKTVTAGKNSGRVVFALADAAVSLSSDIQSILLTVNEIRAHSATKGWLSVAKPQKEYDLLKIYREGKSVLLADVSLDAGTYDQLRLLIGKAVLVKGGTSYDLKVPSNDIKIKGDLVVTQKGQSSVLFDIEAGKSLHVTGGGKYIFAPVVHVTTTTDLLSVQILPSEILKNKVVDFSGGTPHFIADLGMDENGLMKLNFALEPTATLEIVGGAIRIIPKGEPVDIKVSAEAALQTAVASGKIDSALSIKTVIHAGKLAWRVVGLKDGIITIVYIDVTTGTVVATE